MSACSVTQLCQTLRNFLDYSPLGSSVRGIFQTRLLECVVISSSRRSEPASPASHPLLGGFLTTERPGMYDLKVVKNVYFSKIPFYESS